MSSASSAVGPKSYFGPAEGRPRTDLRVPGATSSFSDAVFCAAGAFFAAGVFLTVEVFFAAGPLPLLPC
jgi:hypothetical protein